MKNLLNILKDEPPTEAQPLYGQVITGQCAVCAHRDPTGAVKCEAFPGGIPAIIFFDIYDHEYPYDMDGQDDHGITFLAKDADGDGLKDIFPKG